ncbi:MAG: FHA domain-containing protein [Anaerolineae bacterium]|nr:FHA domain-containing protein [Anaerolineae bacterium]
MTRTVHNTLTLMIMSGVEDGRTLSYAVDDGDGSRDGETWTLTIGRQETRDVVLQRDTFISREHAELILRDGQWWLEDCGSKNGAFVENGDEEKRVTEPIAIQPGQLFRIGRTWLRIQDERDAAN